MTNEAPILSIQNVTKKFIYWSEKPYSIKSILSGLLSASLQRPEKKEITVLDDISFDIYPGEFVGIMGENGAGKSTLMRLLAGIYEPTMGKINIRGKLAPLIELGSGFSEELTGYENIFLNASILGFGRKNTLEHLDEIIEFSEIGDKINMPVKNYSSGMLLRLGFSIASHLEAPIMLLDEVLAVGDAAFQRKCINKITELYAQKRTIILVTHDPGSVMKFCNRCIVINHQKKMFDGDPEEGAKHYLESLTKP